MPESETGFFILYDADSGDWDRDMGLETKGFSSEGYVAFNQMIIPVYGALRTFAETERALFFTPACGEAVSVVVSRNGMKTVRIGYDLFRETEYLLTKGQPPSNASIPAIELHISILRTLILNENIPFVEIPPVPAGFDLTVCLTHDVDFAGICDHVWDRSAMGFLKRAVFGTAGDIARGRIGLRKALKNWGASLKLPLMYLGLAKDCWDRFEEWMEIEKDLHSTYFMIPFKNKAGENVDSPNAARRAAKYDITDLTEIASKLVSSGNEIGVHGIDAWHSHKAAELEKERISSITGEYETGIRMHWLCWKDATPGILDRAGYSWDSSFGYNDSVGFRAGTSQPYIPKGSENLLELPLSIQDTALFYAGRMHLTEEDAWQKCNSVLKQCLLYGGALTVLWHQRSIGPERLWGDFYMRFLEELKNHRVWFATGSRAVQWFRKRREVVFEGSEIKGSNIDVKLSGITADDLPQLNLRLYNPEPSTQAVITTDIPNSIDLTWEGENELLIPI